METEQAEKTLTYLEVSEIAYAIVTKIIHPRLKSDGVKDGSAVWTTCPYDTSAAVRADGKLAGLSVRYEVDSTSELGAATFMLTKSMAYALYAGCLDLIKRDPGWRTARFTPGYERTSTATVGEITMTLTMRVVGLTIEES